MPKAAKVTITAILAVILILAIVVGGYVAYVCFQYYRISDKTPTDIHNNSNRVLQVGEEYSATTYNIGFGSYNPDFTFFMDTGYMEDGTETQGTEARAESLDTVEACTHGAIGVIEELDPDFALFQEVDQSADRSWHVNQVDCITQSFTDMAWTYAENFHTAYLAYPVFNHHGRVRAGLVTLSDYNIDSAIRRKYPVSNAFPDRFFDLDRCFEVVRVPVEGDRELVLINSHMSAYDEGGTVRARQLEMLFDFISSEFEKGNYVIAGGDWNHALHGSVEMLMGQQLRPDWVSVLDNSEVPENFSVVRSENLEQVGTCRGTDIPYQRGVTYEVTVDGFIVSSNITARARTIDTGYQFSDHNPVELTFTLN